MCMQEEAYHTLLASYYLNDVLRLLSEGQSASERLKAARKKFLDFLEGSSQYRAPELLDKVQDTELYHECAVLYGRVSVIGD